MLGALDPSRKDVTLVGAGISGLLLAHRLMRLGYEVTVHEASDRAGGLIRTACNPSGIAESAAHSLLASPAVKKLFEELGVPLIPVRERSRYVMRGGKIRRFPLSSFEVIRAFTRAYFVLADRSVPPEEITLEQWSRRHLGGPATEYLMTPFVRGIFGAEPTELAVGAAFPALKVEWGNSFLSQQLRKKSTRKGKRPMMAPAQGMGSLVSALEKELGSRIRLRSPLKEIPEAGNVALCLPAHEAAQLVRGPEPALASALSRVRYAPLVSATIFVEQVRVPRSVHGVGILLPAVEKRDALGILFNSSAFSERAATGLESFTMMLGGTSRPEFLDMNDEQLREVIERELAEILGIRSGIREIVTHRWQRAVPIYNQELMEFWKTARTGWCSKPGHLIFGNYSGQVSLRGMIENLARL